MSACHHCPAMLKTPSAPFLCVDELSGSFSEIAAVTFGLLDLSPICTEDLRSSSLMEATELWRTFSIVEVFAAFAGRVTLFPT